MIPFVVGVVTGAGCACAVIMVLAICATVKHAEDVLLVSRQRAASCAEAMGMSERELGERIANAPLN